MTVIIFILIMKVISLRRLPNDSNEGKTVNIQAGTGFMQGIFVEYGITVDDEATGIRNGGFGSTTEKK